MPETYSSTLNFDQPFKIWIFMNVTWKKNWKNEMKRFVPQSLLDPFLDIQLMIRSEIIIKAINDIFL